MVETNEKIIGVTKLKETVKEKSSIIASDKLIDEFFSDMEHLEILTMEGKRRFTAVTYKEALNKIEKFDDILRLLENLI